MAIFPSLHERQLGPNHLETAISLTNLADLYADQEKYTEAERLYKRALAIREQQIGLDHLDTVKSLERLALCYKEQLNYEQAEPLYRQALTIYEQQMGPTAEYTYVYRSELVNAYIVQGKYTQAEQLLEHYLDIDKRREFPSVHDFLAYVSSISSLGFVYRLHGKFEQAEPLYRRALVLTEHLGTAGLINQRCQAYMSLLRAMCRERDAMKLQAKYKDIISGRIPWYKTWRPS